MSNKTKYGIKELLVIDKLEVGPVNLEAKKLTIPYVVTKGKEKYSTELIYSYEEPVFEPSDISHQNLASLIGAQVAINYGLFCKKIVFKGLFDSTDRSAIKDWMENTAREIYVMKILHNNPFLTGKAKNIEPVKHKNYLQSELIFESSDTDPVNTKWKFWETDKNKHCVLSSGGKDSLLSYGFLHELGYETQPIFLNESGRHWFTAINAYKYFKAIVPSTGRVWVNSDRVFNFMLKHLSFIRSDYANIRADIYPIRLWTVAVFLFGVLPLLRKRKIGRLIIGDEYDTTVRSSYKGITHYSGLYDQSRYFDEYCTRFFMRKGWAVAQFSILRPLSELMIQTILAKRYPELLKQQVSCHAAHKDDERIKPCGKCEKCRRIVGMLTAVGVDPKICGYNERQIKDCLTALEKIELHQEKAGSQQLMYMLMQKGILDAEKVKQPQSHPEVLSLRFDNDKSPFAAIPADLRKPLYKIYLQYAEKSLIRSERKWKEFDLMQSREIKTPYPFEFESKKNLSKDTNYSDKKNEYLWGSLTWQEAEEILEKIDIALLPVGAIEQHGPHLPLDVDAFDAEYLSRKVAEACSYPKPLVLPLISYGVSYHHEDFKGTISITNETLAKLIYDIGISLAKNGIKKIVIINGHGDNAPTLSYAAQMINRDAGIFVAVDTGETSDVDLDDLCETPNDVHAGEIETSTTLAVRPEKVNMNKAEKNVIKFSSRYLNYSSLRGVPWYVRTKKISDSGIMGDATKGDAEKGKKIWAIMIAHLVAFVEDLKNLKIEDLHQKRY